MGKTNKRNEDWRSNLQSIIGQKVKKFSNKPFQCGKRSVTVKAVVQHPVLGLPAFTFVEDESTVDVRMVVLA